MDTAPGIAEIPALTPIELTGWTRADIGGLTDMQYVVGLESHADGRAHLAMRPSSAPVDGPYFALDFGPEQARVIGAQLLAWAEEQDPIH